MKSLKMIMRGLRSSPVMQLRAAALRFLQAKTIVKHNRVRGLHPDVVAAFRNAMKPIVRRRSSMTSTSRGKNWIPRWGLPVSDRFYYRDKHGSLRRREVPLPRQTWVGRAMAQNMSAA